ncbi:MAG: hypothetical protein ACOYNZ_04735 [Rhodoferax sp.]
MVTSQVRSSSVHAELARVLRVTTQAWGLPEAGPRQTRSWKIATRPQTTQRTICQNNWSRVPVQSLRWAI